jgi:short subunit dehydrogenase-like uncharacterized protein
LDTWPPSPSYNLPRVSIAKQKRKYDLVLWGATGFTGKLVAEYLTRRYGVDREVKWALAGRNPGKLEQVRAELAGIEAKAVKLDLIVGDANDRASLAPVVKDARVVITTVGPYAVHGKEMVAACVEHGTDYVDLTGETNFAREIIDLHHERAGQTGARIVHSCGFDSIPSDLGTLVLQEEMKARHGVRCAEVKFYMGEASGGISGGTLASMMNLFSLAASDKNARRLMGDPYALNPDRKERGPDGRDQSGPRWDPDMKRWTGPFVMAAINTRVVRRSNALLGWAYGKDFRYSECMSFGTGPRGWLTAAGLTAGIAGFALAAAWSPTRALLEKKLPGPGEGPSQQKREKGFFVVRLLGIGEQKNGEAPRLLEVVRGQADPGYGETAKMLSEAALCLAKDNLPTRGGVLTPASAMGVRLVERLRKAGMTFSVEPA